ncbi:helix-turn-helix domain-containing protein [Clostridium sp. LP20]|uniref:helix-turn-helix domain-containing protein n=1 Tax=Clostridium sp. LP20 TaxID=3418665 RepID=UPI003EE5C3E3
MFDPTLLANLTREAQGDRSLSSFAKECGVSAGNLSKIINNKFSQAPTPKTLNKIALHAKNDVTYEDLMKASGYNFDGSLSIEEIDVLSEIKELRDLLLYSPEKVIGSGQKLSADARQSLADALSFGIRQAAILDKLDIKDK